MKVKIGTWHEKADREITHCPSYYAADTETVRTRAGEYPAYVDFKGGYTIPMPYWLLVSLGAVRVSGRLYSGFGGVNFSHTELKPGEEVGYGIQGYSYSIPELIEKGIITLDPGFEFLAAKVAHQHPDAPKAWDDPRLHV